MKSIIVDGSCYNFSDDETFINARDSVISSWNKEWQTAPSPTVEINTFTAKFALEHLKSIFKTGTPMIVEFEQAISKAESKSDSFDDCLKRDNEDFQRVIRESSPSNNQMKGNGGLSNKTLAAETLNKPALPIQDQVNELRGEIYSLKNTISQIQSVIEGMKPNLNAVRG